MLPSLPFFPPPKKRTPVMNGCLNVGPEQDGSSTSHFLLVTTATGKVLEVVGNAGEGEGLDAWRRLVQECDPRATSRASGLMEKLLFFEFTSATSPFELLDKRVPDAQASHGPPHPGRGEVRAGDAAHAGCCVAVPHDHAREQAGHVLQGQRGGAGHRQSQSVALTQIGAVKGKGKKGKGVEGKGEGHLMQAWKGER